MYNREEITLGILFISHIFSLALLMNIRAKYLKFISSKEMHNAVASALKAEAVVPEASKQEPEGKPPYTKPVSPSSKSVSEPPVSSRPLLNINTCSEEELTALPGLNIIDAKRVISLREQNGDFESIEEFITALHIKPHIAAPLYDYITVKPSFKATPQSDSHTRKIDL